MSDMLAKRGQALENAFFVKKDQELLKAFQAKLDSEKLSELTGITDADVLDQLESLGVTSQTVAALGLVPLIEVAWADGRIADEEKAAIVKAAEKAGITPESPSGQLLKSWLDAKPGPELRDGWKQYVGGLKSSLNDASLRAIKAGVIGRATEVAKAAGGLLGIGAMAPLEKNAIRDLESAFE